MNKLLLALFLSFVSLLAFPAQAQEETEEETLAAIPAILKDVKLVNKTKPNLKAKIYFVYQSRSTCVLFYPFRRYRFSYAITTKKLLYIDMSQQNSMSGKKKRSLSERNTSYKTLMHHVFCNFA